MSKQLDPPTLFDPEGELFTETADGVVLRAVRCRECAQTSFPAGAGCQRCGSPKLDTAPLGPDAQLWAATVDRVGALIGEPIGVAWARFATGTIVQGYLLDAVVGGPAPGATVRLQVFELPAGPAAGRRTYAFRAARGDATDA